MYTIVHLKYTDEHAVLLQSLQVFVVHALDVGQQFQNDALVLRQFALALQVLVGVPLLLRDLEVREQQEVQTEVVATPGSLGVQVPPVAVERFQHCLGQVQSLHF